MQDDFLSISALQHIAYCPRQFALIHVEQAWAENRFTAEGQVLHERVDSGVAEQRGSLRSERGVLLTSERYQIKGKMDLLEIETPTGPDAGSPPRYFPVEYKRGKPKVQDWDRIQLCAQALCIEEMRQTQVAQGAIWYWEVRRREPVMIDQSLRSVTLAMIEQARAILATGTTPSPISDRSRCKACSLLDLCEPDTFAKDHSKAYIEQLYSS
ncbi:CRISPR-associated protein Cas4 [Undibacterium rugosum]|uniref:CRISPR-associated protein Cas4 n=1 Tax=Undibacterium rugosum TaxID=2762291 RepID=UPI001B80F1FF|nr:CRISPR-associated protein Cas4 [Undibacterium rugosum]MBR7777325.1 CRISPR-associated protein Cas4 [Undibacterium rugosum]